jgi:hypothetical protein
MSRKGIPNKRTTDLLEIAHELECNPFEILLHFAQGNFTALGLPEWTEKTSKSGETYHEATISPELRQRSAKDACEYLFPKRRAVEHSGPDGTDLFTKLVENLSEGK